MSRLIPALWSLPRTIYSTVIGATGLHFSGKTVFKISKQIGRNKMEQIKYTVNTNY